MDSRTKKPRVENPAREASNQHYDLAKEFQSEGNYNHALECYDDAAAAIAELPNEEWTSVDFLQVLKILGKMMGLIANKKIEYPQAPDESSEEYEDRVWESTTHRINTMTNVMNQLSTANAQLQVKPLVEMDLQVEEDNVAPMPLVATKENPDVTLFSPLTLRLDTLGVTDEEELDIKSPASYRRSSYEWALFGINQANIDAEKGQPLFTSAGPNFK